MARRQINPEDLRQIRELAAGWGKIVAKRAFGEHGPGLSDSILDLSVFAELLDSRLHVAVLLGDGLELLLVLDQGGIGHLAAKIFIAGFELVEAVEHGCS